MVACKGEITHRYDVRDQFRGNAALIREREKKNLM